MKNVLPVLMEGNLKETVNVKTVTRVFLVEYVRDKLSIMIMTNNEL